MFYLKAVRRLWGRGINLKPLAQAANCSLCVMTPREKFILALEAKQPPGRVPHFEVVSFSRWKRSVARI